MVIEAQLSLSVQSYNTTTAYNPPLPLSFITTDMGKAKREPGSYNNCVCTKVIKQSFYF